MNQDDGNNLEACASYTGSKEKTNMVVIEIELLSGFEPTPISLKESKNDKQIKKVEYDEKTSIKGDSPERLPL